MARELVFSFGKYPVGYFEEERYPDKPGRYRYEPFRGPGHYDLAVKINRGEPAECYYDDGADRVSFTVTGEVDIGDLKVALDLKEFKRMHREA